MKLLVCIAAHYATERIIYLNRVLDALQSYQCEVDLIIDTNDYNFPLLEGVSHKRFVHPNLSHPFHLTQKHRQYFKDELENYDWFMYLEDDTLLPWANFLAYTEKFELMWPMFVPSFVRIEEKGEEQFISDVIEMHPVGYNYVQLDPERYFFSFPFPQNYHAFWIMPQQALPETINENFTKLHDSRERAASYPIWELNKRGLVEIEQIEGKWQIKEDCFAYHLPNNYINSSMPNAKIKVKEVFI